MKRILFFLFLLPCFAGAQNYLFEITPQDGQFRVLITDDTRESYPRDITDFGLLDTAALQLLAVQRIENVKSREASLMAQTFLAELNADQTASAVGQVVAIDYNAWAAVQFAGVYDGAYQYEVRGSAVNFPVSIAGGEIRRQSNNNLLATVTPVTANWFTVTVTATSEVIQLYQFGNFWVGRNALGQVVTLKRL